MLGGGIGITSEDEMKQKKEIDKLSASVPSITFPQYNHAFERFKTELRGLLDANFGYTIGKSLDYDDSEQRFFVYVEESNPLSEKMLGRPLCLSLKTSFVINPFEDLGPQFEELGGVIEALRAEYVRLVTLNDLAYRGK